METLDYLDYDQTLKVLCLWEEGHKIDAANEYINLCPLDSHITTTMIAYRVISKYYNRFFYHK